MRIRFLTPSVAIAALVIMAGTSRKAMAQTPTSDAVARLSKVLPADAAQRVITVIRTAQAEGLPSDALANRSLKFAARGIPPQDIARAAGEQLARMRSARDFLRTARSPSPNGDEIEAGAEALRQGVTGPDVARLAKSAPSGRSLTVPLYVMGSLVSRGLHSDQALQRVQGELAARASDTDIEQAGHERATSSHVADGEEHEHGASPAVGAGRGDGEGDAGASTHGPPEGVPANAGAHGRPTEEHGRSTPHPTEKP